MQTLTIDIINEKAVRLIHDMELLKLIHVRKDRTKNEGATNLSAKYKGAMKKQTFNEVDRQLNDLRSSWE